VPKPAGTLASGAQALLRGVNELRDRGAGLRIRPRQRGGNGELQLADLSAEQ
jgi:X-X-X-Leu-X-X-Gly heptad repeat protein